MLERCNKSIAAGGNYFEGDKSFMCVLSVGIWYPDEPLRRNFSRLVPDSPSNYRYYIYTYISFPFAKILGFCILHHMIL